MANRDRDREEEFRGGAEERGGHRSSGSAPYGPGFETGGRRRFGRESEQGGYGPRWQSRSEAYPGRSFSGESGGYGSQGYGEERSEFRGYGPGRTGSLEFGPGSYGRGSEGPDRESGWGGSMGGYGRSEGFGGGPGYGGPGRQEFGGGYAGYGSPSGYSEGQLRTGSRSRGRYTGRGPKNYTRSDDRIREDVSDRLEQHGEIDATEIEVRVENGEVTLEGTVEDRNMKRLAEDAVEDCPGVKQVHNRIRVQGNYSERQRSLGGQATTGQPSTASKPGSTTSRSSTRT